MLKSAQVDPESCAGYDAPEKQVNITTVKLPELPPTYHQAMTCRVTSSGCHSHGWMTHPQRTDEAETQKQTCHAPSLFVPLAIDLYPADL